jgi:hypothetical protein
MFEGLRESYLSQYQTFGRLSLNGRSSLISIEPVDDSSCLCQIAGFFIDALGISRTVPEHNRQRF